MEKELESHVESVPKRAKLLERTDEPELEQVQEQPIVR